MCINYPFIAHATKLLLNFFRIWYLREKDHHGHESPKVHHNHEPMEVGYMNVIPRCLDTTGKYPIYEDRPETYEAVNNYLQENPLEGSYLVTFLWPV